MPQHKVSKHLQSSSKIPAVALIVGALLGLLILWLLLLNYEPAAVDYLAPVQSESLPTDLPQSGVLLLEFTDFECPYCSAFSQVKPELEQTLNLTFTIRHFPLTSIHPRAFGAAVAYECAPQDAGLRAAFASALFAQQSQFGNALYEKIALEFGFDANYTQCLATSATAATIREHMAQGARFGVQGTPSVVIVSNTSFEVIAGIQDASVYADAIRRVLQ